MRRYLWLSLVVIALAALLVPLLSGLVRDVLLVALLRFGWTMDRLVDSVPHMPFWLAFLFVAALVAAISLLPRLHLSGRASEKARRSEGQIADLALLIRRAGRRPYFRRRLVQRLSYLGRTVFAHRHRIELTELQRGPGAARGDLFLAQDGTLTAGRRVHDEPAVDRLRSDASLQMALARLRAEPATPSRGLDPAVEIFVQFLEEQMEVDHARFDRSRH